VVTPQLGQESEWRKVQEVTLQFADICSVFVILKIQWYPHSICRSTLQQFVGHAKNVKEHEGDVSNMLILSQAAVAVPFSC